MTSQARTASAFVIAALAVFLFPTLVGRKERSAR